MLQDRIDLVRVVGLFERHLQLLAGILIGELEVALVYPEDSDDRAGKLSVCTGIGTSILVYKAGDAFSWRIPNRTCHIRIENVLYQPEAEGDFHL